MLCIPKGIPQVSSGVGPGEAAMVEGELGGRGRRGMIAQGVLGKLGRFRQESDMWTF